MRRRSLSLRMVIALETIALAGCTQAPPAVPELAWRARVDMTDSVLPANLNAYAPWSLRATYALPPQRSRTLVELAWPLPLDLNRVTWRIGPAAKVVKPVSLRIAPGAMLEADLPGWEEPAIVQVTIESERGTTAVSLWSEPWPEFSIIQFAGYESDPGCVTGPVRDGPLSPKCRLLDFDDDGDVDLKDYAEVQR